MLILSRRMQETIIIGHDIQIIVLGIQGDKVRLGVIAPEQTSVHRQEIYERIHRKPFKGFKKQTPVNDHFLKEHVIP